MFPVLKHALDLINDSKLEIKAQHLKIQTEDNTSDSSLSNHTHDCKNYFMLKTVF